MAKRSLSTLYGFVGVCVSSIFFTSLAHAQITLPKDPQTKDCSIDKTAFDGWKSGETPEGLPIFSPADSVNFPPFNNTKCDFYKWSSQMFLWATSQTAQAGTLGSFVFDSKIFFDVSASDNGTRTLISNSAPNNFFLRSGKSAKITGETGQAGGGNALISQPKTGVSKASSLIYYGIHINDVYAYFLEGQKKNIFKKDPTHADSNFPNDFPVWPQELAQIIAYAGTQNALLPDAHALTMELKTSWVDASTLLHPEDYLLITAGVPNYITASDTKWTIDSKQPTIVKQLALTGMHIVGTVQGHPEMVWATIEHINNAPDVPYLYENSAGKDTAAGGDNEADWLFMAKGGSFETANISRAVDCDPSQPVDNCVAGDIVQTSGQTIGASNTSRLNPWGNAGISASTKSLYNGNSDVANNNAQLISLNEDVLGFLSAQDARQHYIVSGAVWTNKGGIPIFDNNSNPNAVQVGSLSLANTTMETYQQALQAPPSSSGCFACHSIEAGQGGVEVSHIFDAITPQVPR